MMYLAKKKKKKKKEKKIPRLHCFTYRHFSFFIFSFFFFHFFFFIKKKMYTQLAQFSHCPRMVSTDTRKLTAFRAERGQNIITVPL